MPNSSGCLPFIIGITGHRDIGSFNDVKGINDCKRILKETFEYWRQIVGPHTPLWVYTGLAAGADLISLEVALDMQQGLPVGSMRVIGCLPMPLENFRMDFDKDEGENGWLAKQTSLLKRLQHQGNEVFEVKHALTASQYEEAIVDQNYGEFRNSLYLNQGLFIAKYCNVLISLWDGEESRGIGGTAEVISYKLGAEVQWPEGTENSVLKPISDFDGQTPGIVHHLPVTREGKCSKKNKTEKNIKLKQFANLQNLQLPPIGRLYTSEKVNVGGTSFLGHFLSEEFTVLLSELAVHNKAITQSTVSKKITKNPGLEEKNSIFQAADSLALALQAQYRKLVRIFFFFALPGYILYELAGNLTSTKLGFAVWSIIFLAILSCWGFIQFAARKDLKWKYQLARGVAESMRIRGFLNYANIEPSPTPLIPRRFRLHLPLLNHSISVAELAWWQHEFKFDSKKLKETWIKSQLDFLQSRLNSKTLSFVDLIYNRPKMAKKQMTKYARLFFYLAIFFGMILTTLLALPFLASIKLIEQSSDTLMLLVQYSLMLAGIIALWSELAGYEDMSNGYESLEELYQRASQLIEGEMTASKKNMLLELAREAINEHVTWTSSEKKNDLKQRK